MIMGKINIETGTNIIKIIIDQIISKETRNSIITETEILEKRMFLQETQILDITTTGMRQRTPEKIKKIINYLDK